MCLYLGGFRWLMSNGMTMLRVCACVTWSIDYFCCHNLSMNGPTMRSARHTSSFAVWLNNRLAVLFMTISMSLDRHLIRFCRLLLVTSVLWRLLRDLLILMYYIENGVLYQTNRRIRAQYPWWIDSHADTTVATTVHSRSDKCSANGWPRMLTLTNDWACPFRSSLRKFAGAHRRRTRCLRNHRCLRLTSRRATFTAAFGLVVFRPLLILKYANFTNEYDAWSKCQRIPCPKEIMIHKLVMSSGIRAQILRPGVGRANHYSNTHTSSFSFKR